MKTCTYCSKPILFLCKPHRQYLCGDPDCVRLHRWDDKDKCCFVSPDTAEDYFMYGFAAIAVAVIAAVIYLHYSGVK